VLSQVLCTLKPQQQKKKNAPYRNRRTALIRAKLRELVPQEPDFAEEMAQFCFGLSCWGYRASRRTICQMEGSPRYRYSFS
jgi:hypothetical protein